MILVEEYGLTHGIFVRYAELVASEEDLIKNLNPKITGWKNYYTTKTSRKWNDVML